MALEANRTKIQFNDSIDKMKSIQWFLSLLIPRLI
jgi:hypothetical protein